MGTPWNPRSQYPIKLSSLALSSFLPEINIFLEANFDFTSTLLLTGAVQESEVHILLPLSHIKVNVNWYDWLCTKAARESSLWILCMVQARGD